MTKVGYAAGTLTGSGLYLTVTGSAYDAYGLVFPDRATAEDRAGQLRERQSAAARPDPAEIVVRRVKTVYHPGVTLTQIAYRVLPEPCERCHGLRVIAPDPLVDAEQPVTCPDCEGTGCAPEESPDAEPAPDNELRQLHDPNAEEW